MITWITETYEVSWDEYLDQGDSWSGNMTPGDIGRVLSFNAVLELDQDVAPPHDNFTLSLNIVEDNYNRRVATEAGNYSTNEPARAEMSEDGMNERGEDGMYTSDSAEALLRLLLNSRESGRVRGRGFGRSWLNNPTRMRSSVKSTPTRATTGRSPWKWW